MAVALPAASLCIMRRLYNIASVQIAGISYAEVCCPVCLLRTPCIERSVETEGRNHRPTYWPGHTDSSNYHA